MIPGSTVTHVGIGEGKLGTGSMILEANLGSCLGIAVAWPDERAYALAHVILPCAPDGKFEASRYAETAPAYLLKLLEVPCNRMRELRAVIGGGGNMFSAQKGLPAIGAKNIENGRKALRASKIRLIGMEVGLDIPRRIRVDCARGEISITRMNSEQLPPETWILK